MARTGILVTGAGGFIGRALVARLAAGGMRVIAASRAPLTVCDNVENRVTGALGRSTNFAGLLDGARAVVHLASRAHASPEPGTQWIDEEAATAAALAAAARRAGIERIVLLSSVKAHGAAGRFRASDPLTPADPYGKAKARIEAEMAEAGAMLTVLRPPLVYGPGVRANFRALVRLVAKGVPLPLGGIANRRSLIYIENLIDLVAIALVHPRADGTAFLMRDERDVSTPELVGLIARGLGRPARLFPVPPPLLLPLARLAGRGEDAARLLESLTVDDEATRATLGWHPRVAIEDAVAATCRSMIGP